MSNKFKKRSQENSLRELTFTYNIEEPIVGQTLEIDIRGSNDFINIEVLEADGVTKSDSIFCDDVLDSPHILYVTASKVTSGIIRASAQDALTTDIPVAFVDKKNVRTTLIPEDGTTDAESPITLLLDNTFGTLSVEADEGISVEEVVPNREYNLRSENQESVAGNIRINGIKVNPLVIPVSFRKAVPDPVTIELDPINGLVEEGRTITVTIKDTNALVDLISDDENVIVNRVEGNVFSCLCNAEGTYTLRVQGNGVATTTFPITVSNKVEISVPSSFYSFKQEDLPGYIPVMNVRETVNCLSTNSGVMGTFIENNGNYYIQVDAVDNRFTKDMQSTLRLEHPGDDPIEVDVELLVQRNKVKMPCNGLILQVEKNRIAKFKVPDVDQNDDVDFVKDDNITINREGNIVYVSSNKVGTFEITVKHTEYLDSIVTLKVRDVLSETVVEDPEAPIFDLGVVPSNIRFTTVTEDLVTDVCNSTAFEDDRQRCAFLIQRGPEFIKVLGTKICKYQEVMTKANKKLTGSEAAKCNYSLYTALMSVLNLQDYYDFREAMKFLVKMFKVYHDDSLKDLNLMRFDTYWRYGDTRLEEFKLLSVFLNKYVDLDGQNVKTNGLNFKQEIMSKIIRFCGENVRP